MYWSAEGACIGDETKFFSSVESGQNSQNPFDRLLVVLSITVFHIIQKKRWLLVLLKLLVAYNSSYLFTTHNFKFRSMAVIIIVTKMLFQTSLDFFKCKNIPRTDICTAYFEAMIC